MQTPSFEIAIQKAKVKRAIAEQLGTLSSVAQRDVLADLLLALDEANVESRLVNDAAPATSAPRAPAMQVPLIAEADAPPSTMGRAGRPPSGSTEPSRTDAVYNALKEHPRMPIGALAQRIYPGNPDATHRIRAILWSLKKQKRARNPLPGKWEIVPERT